LALAIVATLVRPAEAGRRSRRSAAAAAAAVAVVPRSTVVAAAPAAVYTQGILLARPDLIVAEVTSKDGTHTVVVKNIGDVAAPATTLRVDFCRPNDGAVVASAQAAVPALEVNRIMRVNVRHVTTAPLQAVAYADASHAVAEKDETNNVRAVLVANHPTAAPLKEVNIEAAAVAPPSARS
jgi:subtilase family serine protease